MLFVYILKYWVTGTFDYSNEIGTKTGKRFYASREKKFRNVLSKASKMSMQELVLFLELVGSQL